MTGGGVAAAFAASTCCVLPLSLATAGVSGAWIASLSVLAPFQLGLRMLAIILLGMGFWIIYRRPARGADGGSCVAVPSQRATKSALWFGTLLMALVLTSGWWQRFIA